MVTYLPDFLGEITLRSSDGVLRAQNMASIKSHEGLAPM
jgi:hypothetical protein